MSEPEATRSNLIRAYTVLAGVPFALTLGLGLIWIYLALLPVLLSAIAMFIGAWIRSEAAKSNRAKRREIIPFWAIPLVTSLAGLGVAMIAVF